MQNHLIYPRLIQHLGGATAVEYGTRSAKVTVGERVIRLPYSQIKLYLDDGIRVAEIATTWAYRNV